MIVYSATKSEFLDHVGRNEIADRILESMRLNGRGGVSPNEVRSWQNSLNFMRNVLDDAAIPADTGASSGGVGAGALKRFSPYLSLYCTGK